MTVNGFYMQKCRFLFLPFPFVLTEVVVVVVVVVFGASKSIFVIVCKNSVKWQNIWV